MGSDDVSLTGGTAVFTTKHAGTGKPVTANGFGLAGTDAANYVLSPTTAATTANIARLAITVTAATDSREYDGTNLSAAVPTTPAGSIQTGDVAAFTQTFDNKNIGTGKTLNPAGAVNDGNGGLNYLVSFQPVTTGEITAKALTGSITAANKPYDGNTSATITSRTLDGVIGTEDVDYVGGTATFDSRNAGTGKTVNATGLSLDGLDAGNYTVNTTASTTANISQLPITVTAVTDSKTYDGTATSDETPAVSVNAIILPDVANFTQAFDNKNAGTGKTLTPSGSVTDGNSGANYLVSFVPVTTGTIEQRTLTVTASASSRPYDGTRAASVTLSDDRVTDDVFTVSYVDALFSDKNAGTNKTVTVSGLSLSGADGGNYVLAATSATATADITPVTLTGHFTAANKFYDGGTAATIVTRTLTGTFGTDDVSLVGGTATFSDKHAGVGKTVTGERIQPHRRRRHQLRAGLEHADHQREHRPAAGHGDGRREEQGLRAGGSAADVLRLERDRGGGRPVQRRADEDAGRGSGKLGHPARHADARAELQFVVHRRQPDHQSVEPVRLLPARRHAHRRHDPQLDQGRPDRAAQVRDLRGRGGEDRRQRRAELQPGRGGVPKHPDDRRCGAHDHRWHGTPLRRLRGPVHSELADAKDRGQVLQGDDDRRGRRLQADRLLQDEVDRTRPISPGSFVTTPATPRAHRRRAVAGSFTVQTCTGHPSRRAAATKRRVGTGSPRWRIGTLRSRYRGCGSRRRNSTAR